MKNKFKIPYLLLMLLVVNTDFSYAQMFKHIEDVSRISGIFKNSVSTADIDNDNDLDLFVVAKQRDVEGKIATYNRLYRNENNGRYTDITTGSGLENIFPNDGSNLIEVELGAVGLEGFKYGSFWGDYDNDGFSDLFLTNYKKVFLFQNKGDGTFEEVTAQAGILKSNNCHNTGATWFDYNKDGYLDLFINDWKGCEKITFYENNGDGTFKDISAKINDLVTSPGLEASYSAFPYDFNDDGWLDIYISYDLKDANRLYINNGDGTFNEQASQFGLDNKIDDMAITSIDYDSDLKFDFFISGIDEATLFRNETNQSFTEVTVDNNLIYPQDNFADYWLWGSQSGDYDLDGDEDLIVATGSSFGIRQRNLYYRNDITQGNGFSEIGVDVGFDKTTVTHEALSLDFDNDGDLDLIFSNSFGSLSFYENTTIDGAPISQNWVQIHLEGTASNKNAYGTEITIQTENNSYKRFYNGVGFIAQNAKAVHFGLGQDTEIQKIKIKWPSGLEENYDDIDVNKHFKCIEASSITVLNLGSEKIEGCTDPISCNYNPLATKDDNSCMYLVAQEITGNTSSSFLKEELYMYASEEAVSVDWSVEGGEIIEGQGTKEVKVKWGVDTNASIMARPFNSDCEAPSVTLQISLDANTDIENASVARLWNEVLLNAIRNDFARPTVHARNLFHFSIALYDAWAIVNEQGSPYLIGTAKTSSPFNGFNSVDKIEDTNKAISYAAYRLLSHRFKDSPGFDATQQKFDLLMEKLNFSTDITSINYEDGDAASLGNYIASVIIDYGLSDGSNEQNDYARLNYAPVNDELILSDTDSEIVLQNPNRWQPLTFTKFIDQSGNVSKNTPDFLSPEWGNVKAFALTEEDKQIVTRDGASYNVYNLPETPPQLNEDEKDISSELYQWNFALVSQWSSHLDPTDGVMIDISPASLGNIDIASIPRAYENYNSFYKENDGGDSSKGHSVNPKTNQPYTPQIVPKGDYTRVLAEFWADGPDSETPPGHWFTILNYVSDHSLTIKKWNGKGAVLSDLEWDVKSYFVLGGAMHDAAIAAWSVKGWVDYIRPVSAIRYMAKLGQSTDTSLDNYHPGGIPLRDNFIEVIEEGDPLAGLSNDNVGKIKVKAWRGHQYINDPSTDVAGVGWILAKDWWPYQRPSFVTPPFAGFVSGHSTFSRAAAEVLTLVTGDPYFPGGIGEFKAEKDKFLVFEKGPSVDVTLQWATYRDASDQTSLSRIWGGIHPPADDLPGRLMGEKIGVDAYDFSIPYFENTDLSASLFEKGSDFFFQNPVTTKYLKIYNSDNHDRIQLFGANGKRYLLKEPSFNSIENGIEIALPEGLAPGIYFLKVNSTAKKLIIL